MTKREEAMRYMLLIQQSDTPLPGSPEWERLSEDEQKAVYADYQAINETPGVTPSGVWLEPPEMATSVRVENGETLTTDGPFVAVKEALGGFDLAEEAAQEAFAIAAERWPREGAPTNPRAWLVTTARNRAIDRIRRDRMLAAKTKLLDVPEATEDIVDETTIPDERLELVFTCCHPALDLDAQVALTLGTLGGLRTEETARAFLVPEQTMAKRLDRAQPNTKVAANRS